jgi:hypothetical protein
MSVTTGPFVGSYPCALSPSGVCLYGGNKYFNYGFLSGAAPYCRKANRWVEDLDLCPITKIYEHLDGDYREE